MAPNYKTGKVHHNPWHSDICTSNQLNIPAAWLSCLFETKNSKQMRRGAHQTSWIISKDTCSINLRSDCIPDAISCSETIPVTIYMYTKAIADAIADSNAVHSHRSTLLHEGWLWRWLCEAVSKYISSWYVAQVDLSISRHICSKRVVGHTVCNCRCPVDSVLDGRDQ